MYDSSNIAFSYRSHSYSKIGRVGSIGRGLILQMVGGRGCWWVVLGIVPCFRAFDVWGEGVGGASGEECFRELLEEGGYL